MKRDFKLDRYGLTITHDDRMIRSTLNLGGQIIQQVIDTQDRAIREALFAMGWRPPGADIADDPGDSTGDTSPSVRGTTKTVRAVVECRVPASVSEKQLVQKLRTILIWPIQLGFPGQQETLVEAKIKSYARVRQAEERRGV